MSIIVIDSLGPKLSKLGYYNRLYSRFDGSITSKKGRYFPGMWGSGYLDGIEVYNKRVVFFHDGFIVDERIKKFIKILGMKWDEFAEYDSDEMNQIDKMWFYIKPHFKWDGTTRFDGNYTGGDWVDTPSFKPTNGLIKPSKEKIAKYMNSVLKVGDELTVEISYGGGLKRYVATHELPWEATGVEVVSGGFNSKSVREKILSDPWYYLANSRHKPYVHDSYQAQTYNSGNSDLATGIKRPSNRRLPVANVALTVDIDKDSKEKRDSDANNLIALMAFMDNGSVFEPIKNKKGEYHFNPKVTTHSTNYMGRDTKTKNCPDDKSPTKILPCDGEILEYRFTVKFKMIEEIDKDSMIVNEVAEWIYAFYQDPGDIPAEVDENSDIYNYKDKLITSTIDTDFKKGLYEVLVQTQPDDYKEITNSLYYNGKLRVDSVRVMKRKDFARLISSQLATDQSLDQPSGWAKIRSRMITVALIIAAILAFVYGQPAAGTALLKVSAGLASAGLALSIGLMLGQATGLMLASDVKFVGRVSMVVGILAAATGIYAAWQAAARRAAAEARNEVTKGVARDAATQEMAKNAANNVGFFDTARAFINNAVDSIVSGLSTFLGVVGKVTQVSNVVVGELSKREQEDFDSELEDKEAIYQDLVDQNEDEVFARVQLLPILKAHDPNKMNTMEAEDARREVNTPRGFHAARQAMMNHYS